MQGSKRVEKLNKHSVSVHYAQRDSFRSSSPEQELGDEVFVEERVMRHTRIIKTTESQPRGRSQSKRVGKASREL